MDAARHRNFFHIAFLVTVLTTVAVAADKVERSGPPPASVSSELRQAVEEKGYRVTLDGGWTGEFWFAKNLATTKKDVSGALYPELSDGEFVGVVSFPRGFSDYRGQSIPAGVYTLRYQLLPQDGNHLGVAPSPDFLLAIPAADDSHPDAIYPYKKLVALSAKSTGGNHPAVIAMEGGGAAGSVNMTDQGYVVFTVAVPSSSGSEKLGIIVKGSASQ